MAAALNKDSSLLGKTCLHLSNHLLSSLSLCSLLFFQTCPVSSLLCIKVNTTKCFLSMGGWVYAVEVGSLHALRLESLIHFFNHASNVLLTNYSFGKSVRTSTLCMTLVIFPTIVYIQIISLIIRCITISVGLKFTYTKLTLPLNSLENSRK